jgi:hypothetical protein
VVKGLIAALVVCVGLAAPGYASAFVVESSAQVDQQLLVLRTTDGQPMRDADCRPQGTQFAMIGQQLNAALWTCYVSDGLSRVYNVTAHIQNTTRVGVKAQGGIDRLTSYSCWKDFSHFPCPPGRRFVLPDEPATAAAASSPSVQQETARLVQQQLMSLKTTDGIRIRQADCRPITWHWTISGDSVIYGNLWTCYVADSLRRVYNVNAHVRNSKAGGIDKLTVLNCWRTYANYSCPRGTKIVLPVMSNGKPAGKVSPPTKTGH